MDVQMIADGLWRWSAVHPEWKPGADWDAEVWCVYCELPDAVVLVDPLVTDDEAERFWKALDRDVERLGLPVSVLVTSPWHERSAAAVEARYGGAREAPARVATYAVSREEVVYWLEPHRALVAGDALLGRDGGIRLQPPSWMDDEPYEPFVRKVAALVELPVELVLTSHGPPVLGNGRAELKRALHYAQSSDATAT